jgi:autotransporter translocation and assembly factor TamB
LQLAVQQDASHFKRQRYAAARLSWHDGWRAGRRWDGAEGAKRGLSLSLNAFGGKTVENFAGELSLDIRARGSAKQPDLSGTFSLRGGKLRAVPLGVDIQEVAASGSLDSRHVTLRQISARAKDGEISGSGSLALRDFQNGAVKLSLAARRWPAIETLRHQIKIDGNVDVQGSLNAPLVKGQLTVSEGSLRPDLDLLSKESSAQARRNDRDLEKQGWPA